MNATYYSILRLYALLGIGVALIAINACTNDGTDDVQPQLNLSQITQPYNNEQIEGNCVSISWQEVPQAQAYNLQIAPTNSFNNLYADTSIATVDTSNTLRYVFNAPLDTLYHVRIRATAGLANGAWSSSVRFTTAFDSENALPNCNDTQPPLSPQLIHPPNNSLQNLSGNTDPINFQWTIMEGATRYQLQINSELNFDVPDFNNSNIIENQHAVQGFENGFWYWRVRAINQTVYGEWSPTQIFSVN